MSFDTVLIADAVRTRRRLGNMWTCACVTKSTSSAYAAEDDFVICRNVRMDMCLCYQVDV